MIRLGFFGNPQLAKRVLQDLWGSSHFEVCFTVTSPDKPTGRSQHLTPTPVKAFATEKGIPVFEPVKVRGNRELLQSITSFEADYFIVVAYGKILPIEVLDAPKKLCLNVHGSLLPLYRGASPIQSALMHGDTVTGITVMTMSEGMDEGDILAMKNIPIDGSETSGTLFAKFEEESGPFLIKTILRYEHGEIIPVAQDPGLATYCTKITKQDGLLDFHDPAGRIFHLWRGLTPWPGIHTFFGGKKLIITQCSHDPEMTEGSIGEVVSGDFGVGIRCGSGVLILKGLKLEGKQEQRIEDFLNGHRDLIGYRFT